MSKHANRIIFSAVLATGAFHFGTTDPARGAQGAQCVVAFYDVVLAPGVSGTPTSGTFSSNGKTATMERTL